MKNYFTSKNEDLIKELEKANVEVPYMDNGNLDRKAAAKTLMSLESASEQKERKMKERVLCVLHGDGTESGQQAQYVAVTEVGGIHYDANIPREVEVDIPAFVYDYLDSLYFTEMIPMEDFETGKIKVMRKQVKRFKLTTIDRYFKD